MKQVVLVTICVCVGIWSFAQYHQLTYQAVLRDSEGNLEANTGCDVKFEFIDSTGALVYEETVTTQTNLFGLFTVRFGESNAYSAGYLADQMQHPLTFQVSIDQGAGFIEIASEEVTQSPKAMFAQQAGAILGVHPNADHTHFSIGKTDPSALLELSGASSIVPQLRLEETASNDYTRLELGNAVNADFWHLAAFTGASKQFNVFHSEMGDVLSINALGHAGIGNPAPAFRLHVSDANTTLAQFDGSNQFWAGIYVNATTEGGKPFYGYKQEGAFIAWDYIGADGKRHFSMSNTDQLTIDPIGRIGIRETSPEKMLHITDASNQGEIRLESGNAVWDIDAHPSTDSFAPNALTMSNGYTDFVVGSYGNSGVNVGSPQSTFHVVDGYGWGNLRLQRGGIYWDIDAHGAGEGDAANGLTVSNGYTNFVYGSYGNAGIGVGSPQSTFHIVDGYGWGNLRLQKGNISWNIDAHTSGESYAANGLTVSNGLTSFVYGSYGNVGIGVGSPQSTFHVVDGFGWGNMRLQTGNYAWNFNVKGSGSNTGTLELTYAGNNNGIRVTTSGSVVTISDKTMKKDVAQLPDVLEKLMAVNPVSYKYVDDETQTKKIGFIAQQVQEQFPHLTYDIGDEKVGLAYDDFAVLAIKAIQEQQVNMEAMKKKIEELEAELKAAR